MRPIVFHFISGDALFSGLLLVLAGCLSGFRRNGRRRIVTSRVLAIVGAVLVVLSAAPLSGWLYAAWLIPLIGSLAGAPTADHQRERTPVRVARALTGVLCIVIAGRQILPLRSPEPDSRQKVMLYVIGDSLSAKTSQVAWPQRIAREHGIAVRNLARPGATTAEALDQAAEVGRDGAVVLIEIGGNDLLSGRPADRFAADLERVLQSVQHPDRRIAMLELPLLPFSNAYGRAQHRLAQEYGVTLIPRRAFARVLTAGGATTDGLHLTPAGHAAMARMVWQHVGNSFASARPRKDDRPIAGSSQRH